MCMGFGVVFRWFVCLGFIFKKGTKISVRDLFLESNNRFIYMVGMLEGNNKVWILLCKVRVVGEHSKV